MPAFGGWVVRPTQPRSRWRFRSAGIRVRDRGTATVVDLETLAQLDARAVVVDLPSVPLLPPLPIVYGVVGDPEVRILSGNLPRSPCRACER